MGGILGGSAYTKNVIRCEATSMGNGEVLLFFTEGYKGLFSATLESCAAQAVAQACADALADSDGLDVWLRAPNPKAAPEALDLVGRDPAELRQIIAEARAKLDAIEASLTPAAPSMLVA